MKHIKENCCLIHDEMFSFFNFKFQKTMKRFQALFIMLLCGTFAFAQNRDITGKVVDSKDGSPLPKISIKIKGPTKGTSTNPDGTFSLEADKDVTLECKYELSA